jgi:hypothetical protein
MYLGFRWKVEDTIIIFVLSSCDSEPFLLLYPIVRCPPPLEDFSNHVANNLLQILQSLRRRTQHIIEIISSYSFRRLSKWVKFSQNLIQSLHSFVGTPLVWSLSGLIVASAELKICSCPYHGIFAWFGHSGETKRWIWPCIRKQCGPFPGGYLNSAHNFVCSLRNYLLCMYSL